MPGLSAFQGNYASIHSSGFRDFLLKPELLRAIIDCGFEHPSEGELTIVIGSIGHTTTYKERTGIINAR